MGFVRVILSDRLDRDFILRGEIGQSLSQFLLQNQIPSDSIIAYENDMVVDDQQYVLKEKSKIKLKMVRAYHLPDFDKMLGVWGPESFKSKNSKDSFYTKRLLWFKDNGNCELKIRDFSRSAFVEWLETVFIDAIQSKNLIEENDSVGLALSGGRDSIALLYLLHRCRSRLPKFSLVTCTVEATAHPSDFPITQKATEISGVEHWEKIPAEKTEHKYRLKVPCDKAINQVYENFGRFGTIYHIHNIMRTGVEGYFKEQNISKIGFGLHLEDLTAGVLRGTLLGWNFGESAWKKTWGPFTQIFPLWPISKKELTLYLECVAPPILSSQGSQEFFDTGDHDRDLHYFIADQLQTLWPGFPLHLFNGLEKRMERFPDKIIHKQCPKCSGYFIPDRAAKNKKEICKTCLTFEELNLAEKFSD